MSDAPSGTPVAPSSPFAPAVGLVIPILLAIGALALAKVPALTPVGPLTIALLLGLVAGPLRRAAGDPSAAEKKGLGFAARTLLRIGVVLVGFRIDIALVRKAGLPVVAIDAVVVLAGLLALFWLGRFLGVPRPLAALLAVGASVCGASAIAAARDATRADDDDVAIGIALCGIVGTSAVLLYVAMRPILGLTPELYATFAGATIHEVAQVMAASSPVPQAIGLATATKLTRVLMLPLVIVGLELALHSPHERKKGGPLLPGFVLGFIVVAILNSLLVAFAPVAIVKPIRENAIFVSALLMTISMGAAGMQIDWGAVRRVGRPALVTMVAGSAVVSLVGYLLVRFGLRG